MAVEERLVPLPCLPDSLAEWAEELPYLEDALTSRFCDLLHERKPLEKRRVV